MNILKKLSSAALLACAVSSAQAGVVLNDWYFNPVGTGFSGAVQVQEHLDISGNAFIQLTPTGGSGFSFVEHGVFAVPSADAYTSPMAGFINGGNISATLEAFGTGNFSGAFSFSGGTIRMYQNPTAGQYGSTGGFYGANLGNLIAEFSLVAGGGGTVNGDGSPTNNGDIRLAASSVAGTIAAGYFFDQQGNDLYQTDFMSYAFTNANTKQNASATLVSEVACQYAGFTGLGCAGGTYANAPGQYFFINAAGQFKLGDVPEPSSVALFGLALAGIGMLGRRRNKSV